MRIERGDRFDPEAQAFDDAAWAEWDAAQGHVWEEQPITLTVRREGRVMGTARGWIGMRMAYLYSIIVRPEDRSAGIGAQLLAAFEQAAEEAGVRRLALRTKQGNPAQRFYERHGWHVEAEFPDWYHGETYVQMRKDL